jgi:DNA repair exonuclease SbcCD nuclease subunit
MFEGEDIVPYDELTGRGVDGWFFGHWHKDQGVVQWGDTTVVNVGSLTRGSLHLDDLDRKPYIVEVDISKEGIEFLKVDVPCRADAFKVEEAILEKKNKSRREEVVDKMKQVAVEDKGLSLIDRVNAITGVEQKVKEIVISYLERV